MADRKIERFIKKLEMRSYTRYFIEDLLRVGTNNNIMCPLHPDFSKNCFVNINEGYFKCASCGMQGNLILLLMLVLKKPFKEIVLMLAKETQTEIPPIILGLKPSWY